MNKNIYIYSPVKDTVDLFLKSTLEYLIKSKYNVYVLHNPNSSIHYTNNKIEYNTIKIFGNNTKPISLLRDIKILQSIKSSDSIIFNGSSTIIMSFIYKIMNPSKNNIYIMHGTLKSKGIFVNFIFLFFLFLSNLLGVKVLYVNKYFNKYFIRKKNTKFLGIAGVGVNKDDIDLILKNRYVIEKAKDIFTIAFIGRHETSKGYDLFVEIANKNSSNQINFITIGGNSINNSNSKLTNLGRMHRQDIFNYYKNIDILIMPSFSEGIGMSMVECCIAGIPTIASQTDGSKQFIINNYNGLIINSRKPELYINAIKKIINNYDKFSRNCIEYSEKNNNFLSKPILDI